MRIRGWMVGAMFCGLAGFTACGGEEPGNLSSASNETISGTTTGEEVNGEEGSSVSPLTGYGWYSRGDRGDHRRHNRRHNNDRNCGWGNNCNYSSCDRCNCDCDDDDDRCFGRCYRNCDYYRNYFYDNDCGCDDRDDGCWGRCFRRYDRVCDDCGYGGCGGGAVIAGPNGAVVAGPGGVAVVGGGGCANGTCAVGGRCGGYNDGWGYRDGYGYGDGWGYGGGGCYGDSCGRDGVTVVGRDGYGNVGVFGACGANYASCSRYDDCTGNRERVIYFGGSYGNVYTPRCMTVRRGQTVNFVGPFDTYPIAQACGPESITYVRSGYGNAYTFRRAGVYGFYNSNYGSVGGYGMTVNINVID